MGTLTHTTDIIYDTIIIGSGISGLTTAYLLKKQGKKILVIEKNTTAGGHLHTENHLGFQLESGPHSFMGSAEFVGKLIQELKLEGAVQKADPVSNNRYIYRNNQLHALPLSVLNFITTPLLSLKAKFRLMLEPLVPNGAKEAETAWSFFKRRFGKEAATYIMSPFVSGVYAGDVHQLGAKSAFAKFWYFEKEHGSMILGALKFLRAKKKRLLSQGIKPKKGLYSFEKGLGQITEVLTQELKQDILLNCDIHAITQTEPWFSLHTHNTLLKTKTLVLATPPQDSAALLKNWAGNLSPLFHKIPLAPVTLVQWSVPVSVPIPRGFGFLMPKTNNKRVLGTLFPSYIFPDRAPQEKILLASFYGGVQDPSAQQLTDAELTQLLIAEHEDIFHTNLTQAEILRIKRYEHAIPQLLPEHEQILSEIRHILKKYPGLFLAGNYLTGVGMENAVQSGFEAAEKALREMGNEC